MSATSSPNVGLNTPSSTSPAAAVQVSNTPGIQTPITVDQTLSVASGLPSQLAVSSLGSSLGLHPTLLAQTSSGRPICDAPAFVPTFSPPSGSLAPEFVFSGTSVSGTSSTPLCSTSTVMPAVVPNSFGSALSVLGMPFGTANTAPFVVGPGYIPIPPKLVQTIVGGQFIDLPVLIQESSDEEQTTCTLLDGQLVINPGPRKVKAITDIVTWVQAFSIYASIYCAHHSQRARDLWLYQLFIVRLAKQFRGLTWANYDKAYRRDAAARNITDWSQMNVELFNFHSAASRVDFAPTFVQPRRASTEARGTPSSQFVCRSWNKGHCSCVVAVCRYRHACDVPGCFREHRGINHQQFTANDNRPAKRFR